MPYTRFIHMMWRLNVAVLMLRHLQPPAISWPGFLAAADFSWNARVPEGSPAWRGGGGKDPGERLTLDSVLSRVAGGIDRLIMAEAGGVVGSVLLTIGKIYAKVGRSTIANRSALYDLLMLANRKTSLVRADVVPGHTIDSASLREALRSLGETETLLAAHEAQRFEPPAPGATAVGGGGRRGWPARAATWGGELVRRELRWVVRLLIVGVCPRREQSLLRACLLGKKCSAAAGCLLAWLVARCVRARVRCTEAAAHQHARSGSCASSSLHTAEDVTSPSTSTRRWPTSWMPSSPRFEYCGPSAAEEARVSTTAGRRAYCTCAWVVLPARPRRPSS
jgi:hypothetical protein